MSKATHRYLLNLKHSRTDIFWMNKYVFKTSPKLPSGIEQTKPETWSSLLVSLTDTPQLAFLLQHCSGTSCSTKNIQQRCSRAQVSKKTSDCITFLLDSPPHPPPLPRGRAFLTPGQIIMHYSLMERGTHGTQMLYSFLSVTLWFNNLF